MRVVEVTEVVVERPLLDGARVRVNRHQLVTMSESAATIAYDLMTERPAERGVVLYYALDVTVVGVPQVEPTVIIGGDGTLRGMIPPRNREKPWRRPDRCGYRLGDLVGFVRRDVYRVGVVVALPPSPEDAAPGGSAITGDDVYLVGLLDAGGNAESDDHEHVPQPLLFPVQQGVTPELGAALKKRFEVESALGECFLIFGKRKLAEKNGKKPWARARRWAAEFERELARRMNGLCVHPVKRAFDRQVAFEEVVAEMRGTIESLRAYAEREYGKTVANVRRGLDDEDVKEFWSRAREAARAIVSGAE